MCTSLFDGIAITSWIEVHRGGVRRDLRFSLCVRLTEKLYIVFVVICLISVCGGLAVGVVLGSMGLGISISSLFAAVLSTLEVLLVWFQAY
jgi:hypothetical protein